MATTPTEGEIRVGSGHQVNDIYVRIAKKLIEKTKKIIPK
jgi:hypothetical protein